MKKTDYVVYPAVFDNTDNDGYYTVTFPDIPDTVSQGKNLAEAIKRAPDAIAVVLPDYKTYPKPTSIAKVQKDNPGSIVSLVGVDMKKVREKTRDIRIHKNVTVPRSLASWAEKKGINFSDTLTKALEELQES